MLRLPNPNPPKVLQAALVSGGALSGCSGSLSLSAGQSFGGRPCGYLCSGQSLLAPLTLERSGASFGLFPGNVQGSCTVLCSNEEDLVKFIDGFTYSSTKVPRMGGFRDLEPFPPQSFDPLDVRVVGLTV